MTKKQKKMLLRIMISFVLLAALMVCEHIGVLPENIWIELVLFAVPYLIIGYDIIFKAAKNIRHGQIFDENFLMMIATFGAFGAQDFSEAAAVMLFYQVGELFQSYAVGKSRQSISDMMDICPEYANIEENGTLIRTDPDDVEVGSIIVVKPGERVPLDGVVTEGESLLDTAALTGESVPRRAAVGDEIISGCVNGSGTLKVRTTKAFDDSTVSKILELVENASSKKAKVENFITKFARYYTPVVTIAAVILAALPPLLLGGGWSEWIHRACIFLVISCPCALVISVPLGFFGGIGAASRIGVLVKGGNYLEAVAEMTTIVFDKTGTLTKGEFKVSGLYAENGFSQEALLELAAHAEGYSNHPIADSVRAAYLERTGKAVDLGRVGEAGEQAGHGISVTVDGKKVLIGNEKLMKANGINCAISKELKVLEDNHPNLVKSAGTDYTSVTESGTVCYVACENEYAQNEYAQNEHAQNEHAQNEHAQNEHAQNEHAQNEHAHFEYVGAVIISDTIKEGARAAIADMKKVGVQKCIMLTGDRKAAAKAVAGELGIDELHAELLPADKVARVEALLNDRDKKERLAFVGDGINDAPVLARADIGFAMGSMGSDAAIEAADVVLMDDDVRKIAAVVRIARKTLRIVKQNIVFALAVKALVLILGALGMANMWEAVFADVGVAVIAILNAMRTLRYNGR